jgi:hypothetical protein
MDLGTFQKDIVDLPTLNEFRYENIFKLYKTGGNQYFYNILSTVSVSNNLDSNIFYNVVLNEKTPWTVISYGAYGSIDLWWLIAIVNGIKNPLQLPSSGSIKILKPQYVRSVISQLTQIVQ